MNAQESVQWSFVSLLVGGVLILVGGIGMPLMMGGFGFGTPMSSMMGGYGYAPGWGAWAWWMITISLVSGAVVLVAASRVRLDHRSRRMGGILGIVGGAVSLLAMGGWIIGAVASIIGGALALTSERAPEQRP